MIKASSKIVINASPDRVAQVVFDPTKDSQWLSGVLSSDFSEGSDLRVGSKISKKAEYFGKRYDAEFEIVEFQKDELLRLRTEKPLPFEVLFKLERVAAGTEFEMSLAALDKLPVPLPEFIVKRALEESISRDLKKLAGILESGK